MLGPAIRHLDDGDAGGCAELTEHSRASDLVARLGGDEFVVILDLTRPLDVTARGRGLVRDVAEHPWNQLAPELRVTVSAGFARGACCDVVDLLTAADQHLYQAKSDGRGCLVADSPAHRSPYRS
jgi:diguanylate cyclase (GGDEF)-like protein